MDEKEFMKLFSELCTAYRQEFDKERGLVYFKYLCSCPMDKLKSVVEWFIRHGGKFFPTISELIDVLDPPDVGKAWQRVYEVACGGCRSWPKLSDAEIVTVSAIGGMHLIQNATDESLHFICNDFKRAYPVIVKRENRLHSDDERLKDLNMVPETYLFIKKSIELKEMRTEKIEKPETLKLLLAKTSRVNPNIWRRSRKNG